MTIRAALTRNVARLFPVIASAICLIQVLATNVILRSNMYIDAYTALSKSTDLLKGGVFTKDVIDVWLEYKRKKEIDPVRMRPHPYEFYLYFDI